ncbi:MAG: EamA family transporter [Acidobacteria bacterium]|nr:EamA family transporter [Acidobacteriota bacterium]
MSEVGREKFGAYGAWAAVCFFWGTTYLAIAVGLESFQPTLFAGMAALMVATSPFWAAALERVQKDGERVGLRGLLGMAIGFGGLAMLVGPQLFGTGLNGKYLLGVVIIQVGCFAWQAGSVYAKRRPTGVSPLMGSAVQMLLAGAVLTLAGTLAGEWGRMAFSARSAGALVYLVVFGSIVAYSAYMYAIQKLPLSLVSTYSYVNPLVALVLGWMVLSEPLGWREAGAALVILLGVALVKTSPKDVALLLSRLRRAGRSAPARDAGPIHVTQSGAACK